MAADWTEFAVSGVSETTPQNIMLGAGTLYKNFTYEKRRTNGKERSLVRLPVAIS